jgi:nickel transport protein
MKTSLLTKYLVGFVFYSVLLFSGIDSAYAHKVMLFAWTDGDQIFTQSKFSGGKKVKGQKITVYDPNDRKLLEGKTDDKGEFSFNVPERTTLKLVLSAGAGHRAEWTVTREEIEEMSGEKSAKSILTKPQGKVPIDAPPSETDRTRANGKPQARNPQGPDTDQIERAVERALDKKLKPVIKMIDDSLDRGPTVGEILGGIGYIIGLMGIAAYFHYRRGKD